MIPKTHTSLDVYLVQAGLKANSAATPKTHVPLDGSANTRFGEVLDAAAEKKTPTAAKAVRGVTLADYRRLRKTDAASTFFSNSTLFSGRLDRLATHPFDRMPEPSRPKPVVAVKPLEDAGTSPIDPAADEGDSRASIQGCIEAAARKYNLPSRLIHSVIRTESNFRADAVSPAGAQGLMQLMPATARELGVADPFDAGQNIDGGARYLRQMLDRFGGDLKRALAAYNAGPGTVARYDGDVPYPETRDYVRRVLSGMNAAGHRSA